MSFPRRRFRSYTAWLALVAVMLAALMPSLSLAIGGGTLTRVCSADGARWVAADADPARPDPAPAGPAHAWGHCPYCSLHLDALPPPAVPAVVPLPLQRAALPPAFLQAPRTLFAWRPAQPRAPPVSLG
jgi:hypothetical protein